MASLGNPARRYPEGIREAVEALQDLAQLELLLEVAFRSEFLEAFAATY